ncbi:MAG: hypothetical protein B7Y99_13440 [Caulobacterales bacterium 32-69-10]|nr:MAG: hypothetical protein B7Y99_13440 [Caulobacterales bacterium 32-69-10]
MKTTTSVSARRFRRSARFSATMVAPPKLSGAKWMLTVNTRIALRGAGGASREAMGATCALATASGS